MSRKIMLVMVDTGGNNNKFYELTENLDGTVTARYGRVGGSESFATYPAGKFDSKMREKLRKGYTVREQADSSTASVPSIDASERVSRSLFSTTVNAALKKFTETLLRNNRHAISDATGGKITVSTSGTVTTALGPVTQNQLSRARVLLKEIRNGDLSPAVVDEYLVLIPQKVKNVRERSWITPSWIGDQEDLLDALESALATTRTSVNGSDLPDIPFRNKLTLLDSSSDEFARIEAKFHMTRNVNHSSAGKKLLRVWAIEDVDAAKWEKSFKTLKHHRELWHGTTAGNVLSILRTGLICPPSSDRKFAASGRMFGDGVYFSDQSTKSLNYATGTWSRDIGSGNPMMFLADVVMGREYRPTVHDYNIPSNARTKRDEKGRPFNSINVRGGTCGVRNNEMIVWNTEQIKLTYLCEFER